MIVEEVRAQLEHRLREALALQQRGALAEAGQQLAALLREYPQVPELHRAMALLASQAGHQPQALAHMAKACELAPDSTDLRFQLGCLLAHGGRFEQALPHFRAVVEDAPALADGWYFLGLALMRLARDREALAPLRQAYRLAPEQTRNLKALAELEFRIGYPADALPLWQALLERVPSDREVYLKTAETLGRLGFHEQALAVCRRGLEALPDSSDLWMGLAQAEEDAGDRDAARAAYERALALRPGWAFPLSGLLGLQRGKAPDALVQLASRLQQSATLPDPDRALIGYELGKVFDGRGDYAQAMASWHDANAARRRMIGEADFNRLACNTDETIRTFPRGTFDAGPPGSDDSRFVFIVGMPRSGTTLTEQIIASHAQAHGCGELPDIALIARHMPLDLQQRLVSGAHAPGDLAALRGAIDRYVEAATRHAPANAVRLVDKAPLNFFHLGLIALMFPKARVVWCRRDPRDVAVSIYGENFSLEERLATSFAGIGHYVNLQNRLMRHWQSVSPLPILELHYEELVSATEAQARRLIEFTGLPWDPACLQFHRSQRGVQTPSRWQVKQPTHTRSIGRWRHYEDALAPLLEVLEPHSY